MAIKMTTTEVKARILAVVDQVAAGEEVEITRYGRTIARLVPASDSQALTGSFSGVATTASEQDADLYSTGVDWNRP